MGTQGEIEEERNATEGIALSLILILNTTSLFGLCPNFQEESEMMIQAANSS